MANLRELELVEEREGGYRVNFTERKGPPPTVKLYSTREDEYSAMVGEVSRLILDEQVRPEDILVLFPQKELCERFIGELEDSEVRQSLHGILRPFGNNPAINQFIFRRRYLTVSTIHGAKGYDSWVTLFGGIDELRYDHKSRAAFYVGATRAKLVLRASGLKGDFGREVENVVRDVV